MKTSAPSPRAAFTLLELLTVIAIIGVLAAILIPVVGKVRGQARQAKAASILREMQRANILYAHEHRGAYVPIYANDPVNSSQKTHWMDNTTYRSLLGIGTKTLSNWDAGMLSPTARSTLVRDSWGYNLTGVPGGWSVPGFVSGVTISKVARPSQSIAFADALDSLIAKDGADRYVDGTDTYTLQAIAYRHDGRANVVFWDGHVKSVTRAEAVGNDALWNILQ
jgi:prepilin-type processing-associated H-X9-DG protein/prepilin-type N-terminal cleavage/methylation domain-containing protein